MQSASENIDSYHHHHHREKTRQCCWLWWGAKPSHPAKPLSSPDPGQSKNSPRNLLLFPTGNTPNFPLSSFLFMSLRDSWCSSITLLPDFFVFGHRLLLIVCHLEKSSVQHFCCRLNGEAWKKMSIIIASSFLFLLCIFQLPFCLSLFGWWVAGVTIDFWMHCINSLSSCVCSTSPSTIFNLPCSSCNVRNVEYKKPCFW